MKPNEVDAEILADFLTRFVDWLNRHGYNTPTPGKNLSALVSEFLLLEDPQMTGENLSALVSEFLFLEDSQIEFLDENK